LISNIESISTTSLLPLNVQNFTYGDGGMMTPNDYEVYWIISNISITYMRGIKGLLW
jgi:hypothetical protein